MTVKLECKCKYCKESYDVKEVKRIFGKESFVYNLGYCSAVCYTKSRLK